jgi:hypothetical protein
MIFVGAHFVASLLVGLTLVTLTLKPLLERGLASDATGDAWPIAWFP